MGLDSASWLLPTSSFFHRPTAPRLDRRAWQPARTDAQLRPHGGGRHASLSLFYLPAGLRPGAFVLADRSIRHANRCWKNNIPLDENAQTLAKSFGAAGYQTGYIGKWHLGDPASEGAVAAAQRGGYDYWLAANALEMTSDAYDTRLYNSHGEEVTLPGYRVDALTDAAIRFIDDKKDAPFFLFISYLEPHHQNHRDGLSGADWLRRTLYRSLDTARFAGVGRHERASSAGLLGHGQAFGRSVGAFAGRADFAGIGRKYRRAFHVGSRQSFQKRATANTNAVATTPRSACRPRLAGLDSTTVGSCAS